MLLNVESKQDKVPIPNELWKLWLAPDFKDKLLLAIKASPFSCVLFVESVNSVLQEEQMDIQIRFRKFCC